MNHDLGMVRRSTRPSPTQRLCPCRQDLRVPVDLGIHSRCWSQFLKGTWEATAQGGVAWDACAAAWVNELAALWAPLGDLGEGKLSRGRGGREEVVFILAPVSHD